MEENKFNFSDEENEKAAEPSKDNVKKEAKGLFESIRIFFKELLDFRHDTDRDATIEAIKADIPFKGATAWILIFAIFVASIGLNVSSTAVVIGAMLISPLMGPILGIGMSLAINDIDTLKSAFINLLVMVFLSVLTAYLYFWLSPLTELTPELEARTRPNILDVLVAIFGGLALIVARTKKGTISAVILGVAIATALMPPLCTAGYGLAVGNMAYFTGAMYLFTINTIFIALATFLVLKILRFPMLKYANSKKRRRIAQAAAFFGVIVMIPAIWTFIIVLKESGYERDYKTFLAEEIHSNYDLGLYREKMDMDAQRIDLFFNGTITQATRTDLVNELKGYEHIKDFKIEVHDNDNHNATKSIDQLQESLKRAFSDLDKKDNIISGLQKEIGGLKEEVVNLNAQITEQANRKPAGIPFLQLAKDAKIRFVELEYFSYSKMPESKNFIKVDTISVAHLKWNTSLNDSIMTLREKELELWLKQELKTEKLILKRNN